MMVATGTGRHRAAFLDRDGVINIDRGYVARREDFRFVPGVLAGSRRLHELGFVLVVITNQSGIGRGLYDVEAFEQLTRWMKEQFEAAGAPLAGVYFCPHHPTEAVGQFRRTCDCRKPAPGMLIAAAQDLSLDLGASVLFGDKESDLLAALAAGLSERILLGSDGIATPSAPAGLATRSYRSLAEALCDDELLTQLASHRQPV